MAEIDSTDDAPLDLKKRARRRLVGAAALALLAVIVLPMVMDDEPKPLSQDIQIRIPKQDSVAPAAPLVLPAPPPAPAVEAAAPAAAELKAETLSPAMREAARPAAAPESRAEVAKPGKAAELPAAPAAAREAKPEPEPEAKAAAKPDQKREQWVVQLGAYQQSGNVRLLLAKVKELGYPVYSERVDSEQGPRTRVRAGPFPTREKAQKAQAALKRIGAGGPSGGIVGPK